MAGAWLTPTTLARCLRGANRRDVPRAVAERGRLTVVDGFFLVGAIPCESLVTDFRAVLTVVALTFSSRRIARSRGYVRLSQVGFGWSR